MAESADEYGAHCGLWLDRRWRACPTCRARLQRADRIDRTERILSWVIVAAGCALTAGAFLPWSRTTIPASGSTIRWGMSGGRGAVALILGLAVIAVGVLSLVGRRFPGNRATLAVI